MLLCVKKHIPIPHVLHFKGQVIELKPFAEVPNEYGAAFIKNQSQNFFEITKEEADKLSDPVKAGYTVKDAFKNKSIQDIVATLSDDDKLKVYDLAKKLAVKAVVPPAPETSGTIPDAKPKKAPKE